MPQSKAIFGKTDSKYKVYFRLTATKVIDIDSVTHNFSKYVLITIA